MIKHPMNRFSLRESFSAGSDRKVAGQKNIEINASSSLNLYIPLWHAKGDGTCRDHHPYNCHCHSNQKLGIPFSREELEDAVVSICVKEEPWSSDPYDSDAILKTSCSIAYDNNRVTGAIRSAGIMVHLKHSETVIEPGKYFYSIDIAWSDDKWDKVQQGLFIVHPNTINHMDYKVADSSDFVKDENGDPVNLNDALYGILTSIYNTVIIKADGLPYNGDTYLGYSNGDPVLLADAVQNALTSDGETVVITPKGAADVDGMYVYNSKGKESREFWEALNDALTSGSIIIERRNK